MVVSAYCFRFVFHAAVAFVLHRVRIKRCVIAGKVAEQALRKMTILKINRVYRIPLDLYGQTDIPEWKR
jgi:hypothetical protein